jgi:exodeoxyribonuclease VII large subunit
MKKQNALVHYQQLVKIRTQETLRAEKKSLGSIQDKLRLVDPLNILKRGYSLTLVDGKILKSVKHVKKGDLLETQLRDGKVISIVDRKEE